MNSYLTFFSELPQYFKEIGSVCPSSPFLTTKLLESAPVLSRPRSILEVGPGTGALTVKILESLKPHDTFVAYELNEKFATSVAKMVKESGVNSEQVEVHNADILELPVLNEDEKFDVIFSGLPFLNFQPEDVGRILKVLKESLAEDGAIVFFGYLALGKLGQPFRSKAERERIEGVQSCIDEFCAQAVEKKVKKVFLNIPPAHGTMLRF